MMSSIQDLVAEVVGDAVGWRPGSFAVFASKAVPGWYVQFIVGVARELTVEVADPDHFGGPSYEAHKLASLAHLGFVASPENYTRRMPFETDVERKEVERTIEAALIDIVGLRTGDDVTLDTSQEGEIVQGGSPDATRHNAPAAASLRSLLQSGGSGDAQPSPRTFNSPALDAWFDGSRGEDPDVRAALAAALNSPGSASDYLQVLGNAFDEFSGYRRVREDIEWLVHAEEVARQMLELGELARTCGWTLNDHYMGSAISMFYAREGLMTEAHRAEAVFGVDEYSRDDFEAKVAAWEKAS